MRVSRPRRVLWLLALLALLCGCDPVARHRYLTTFFDDVPSLPDVEQYCAEAMEKEAKQAADAQHPKKAQPVYEASIHPPYGDKRCNGCHQSDKTSVSGLLKPENELCFMCHPAILKHRFAHGPAAEGDCLACHLPHESSYPALLAREPGKVCEKCHSEPRSAAAMHDRIKEHGADCISCHDPHSGESRFFLK